MMYFYQAAFVHQAALLTVMFLTMLLSLFCLGLSRYGKRGLLSGAVDAAVFLVLFAFVELGSEAVQGIHAGHEPQNRLPVPVWALWSITLCAAAWMLREASARLRRLRNTVGRHSVKAAMDTLPGAVCFFNPDGTVKLCNLQMHRLFRSLAQSDLQTLSELRDALEGLDGTSGVVKLPEAENTCLFPDGRVWRYTQNEVTAPGGVCYTEALFSDVTELYEKQRELKKRNAQRKEMYRQIKVLSENVLELTREREILSAKTNLHDQMGAGITAIRQSLRQRSTSEENAKAIELLFSAVKIIKNDNESPVGRTDVEEFIYNARAVGVQIDMTGSLPGEEKRRRLFLLAMKECCTNAVRHADAKALLVRAEKTEGAYLLRIENDGTPPAGEIRPRGGLRNLERYAAEYGGKVEIRSKPRFCLTVTVPAETVREEVFA